MSEELSISEIEKILLKDSHIVTIHSAREWAIPEIDYSFFKPESQEKAKECVAALERYLDCPLIEDDFEDHNSRRTWRDRLEKQYDWFHEFYNNNALKIAKTTEISIAFFRLESYCTNLIKKSFQELNQKRSQLSKNKIYSSRSTQEKIDYVNEVKVIIYDALKLFSVKERSTH